MTKLTTINLRALKMSFGAIMAHVNLHRTRSIKNYFWNLSSLDPGSIRGFCAALKLERDRLTLNKVALEKTLRDI